MTTRAGLYGPEAILQTDGSPAALLGVLVFDADGVTPSALYSDQSRTLMLPQPATTDALGNLSFYAEPGLHVLSIRGATVTVQVAVNPADDLSTFPAIFSMPGALAVGTGTSRFYLPEAYNLAGPIIAAVGTAPTGQPILIDVNYNGSSIYTGIPASRPQVLAGSNVGQGGAATVTAFAAGGYLTVDRDQVGSGIAGSDLVAVIPLQRAG